MVRRLSCESAMTTTVRSSTMSPEQVLAEVRCFAQERLAPVVTAFETAHGYPRELLRELAGLGALGWLFEPGGAWLHHQILEILAEHWLAAAESMNLQMLAMQPLARYGSAELRAELLPEMIAMRLIGGNCFTEPDAGSDLSDLKTVAVEDGDDFVLSGVKEWVGHGPVADLFNVFCRTGGTGLGGISCLLVDRAAPGVSVGRTNSKMGTHSFPTADVIFDEVRVPRRRLIGRKNRGMIAAATLFEHGKVGLAACAVGLSQAALRYSTDYAKRRVQVGQPIFRFQGVSFLLADMATSIAAARTLCRLAAEALNTPDAPLLAAQAKLFATDAAMRITTDAVQILGAYGYSTDHPVERWMREAKVLQIIQGTSQIQRQTIASFL
jgi:alkylation response protein AidB-like acyl-CoA dehydrogenase